MKKEVFINTNPYRVSENAQYIIKTIIDELGYDVTDNPKHASLALSVGGDGTFIDTANLACEADIIGINKGTLGYLTEVEEYDIMDALKAYDAGKCTIEKRMRADCIVCRNNPAETDNFMGSALNDIVICKDKSSVIDIEIKVNGCIIAQYYADGVIISTPTGSTGYAFSCGAPIVDPSSQMLIITPIAPHSIMNRSICVSADACISIKLIGARNCDCCSLEIDGKKHTIETKNTVNVTKSERYTRYVKFDIHTGFLDRIMKKMW